jgi:hypothetical protein
MQSSPSFPQRGQKGSPLREGSKSQEKTIDSLAFYFFLGFSSTFKGATAAVPLSPIALTV